MPVRAIEWRACLYIYLPKALMVRYDRSLEIMPSIFSTENIKLWAVSMIFCASSSFLSIMAVIHANQEFNL
jgi:hypothetical protein